MGFSSLICFAIRFADGLYALCAQCMVDGAGKLVAAGCAFEAAGVAQQNVADFGSVLAFDEFADGLEVAVAAAKELYIVEFAVIYSEVDHM